MTKNYLKIILLILLNNTERKIIKKLLITLALVLFSSSAFAGSCLKLVGKVDEKMQQVMELRDAGKKAHEEGDHAKSEELLIKALNLFKS